MLEITTKTFNTPGEAEQLHKRLKSMKADVTDIEHDGDTYTFDIYTETKDEE